MFKSLLHRPADQATHSLRSSFSGAMQLKVLLEHKDSAVEVDALASASFGQLRVSLAASARAQWQPKAAATGPARAGCGSADLFPAPRGLSPAVPRPREERHRPAHRGWRQVRWPPLPGPLALSGCAAWTHRLLQGPGSWSWRRQPTARASLTLCAARPQLRPQLPKHTRAPACDAARSGPRTGADRHAGCSVPPTWTQFGSEATAQPGPAAAAAAPESWAPIRGQPAGAPQQGHSPLPDGHGPQLGLQGLQQPQWQPEYVAGRPQVPPSSQAQQPLPPADPHLQAIAAVSQSVDALEAQARPALQPAT